MYHLTLFHRLYGDVSVEGRGLHSVLVEDINAGAAYTCGGVVEVEGVAVGLGLQLVGELALGQVVGREGIGVEVEGLVHGNLHSLTLLVEQLHVAVVGAQGMVLREEVGLVHVGDGLAPDA